MKLPDLAEHAENFRVRFWQELWAEALSIYWTRRAAQFAAVGTSACDETAQACRNAASLAMGRTDRIVCVTCETSTSPQTCSCGQTRVEGAA